MSGQYISYISAGPKQDQTQLYPSTLGVNGVVPHDSNPSTQIAPDHRHYQTQPGHASPVEADMATTLEDPHATGAPEKPALNGNAVVELGSSELQSDDSSEASGRQGRCSRSVAVIEESARKFCRRHRSAIILFIKLFLLTVYLAFFIKSMIHHVGDQGSYELIGVTAFIILLIVINQLRKSPLLPKLSASLGRLAAKRGCISLRKVAKNLLYLIAVVGLGIYLGVEIMRDSLRNAQALVGIASLILGCYIFSKSPSRVNWHPVFWGFVLQFFFGVLTLRTTPGYEIFKWMGDLVTEFVRLSDAGSNFVFGDSFTATKPGFFFETAGMIVFFNACIFVLDYFGVLEAVILTLGRGLAFCLDTGPIESVVAAANIFIGLSEAPLLVRPYLSVITKSELHAIMTTGFSSISGAFMAMFINEGAPATHLLTACLISAPAALAISKLMYPELEKVDFSKQQDIRMRDSTSPKTVMQAIADGATFSLRLIGTIMVNMMAFVSILALVDSLIIWCGQRAGWPQLSFNYISSYVFYPLSWVMGIASHDCRRASYLMGLKLLATPFVAYSDLGDMIQNREIFEDYKLNNIGNWSYHGNDIFLHASNTTLVDGVFEPRTEAILTYAMCGLSAFPAIGFSMGTLIPMSPSRKADVISLVVRAFIAGNLANFATGAVAGVLFNG